MPQYAYRARDRDGRLRAGQRFSNTIDDLSAELIKEGIYPIKISLYQEERTFLHKLRNWMQGEALHLEELAIFSRQMQLLHQASVPMVTALKQLANYTRSNRLSFALKGVIEHLEMGQSLSTAMQYYPDTFSPLIVNIVQIGENTGHLSEAFAHLHQYIAFEVSSRKQIKAAFRYPMLIGISIIFAILILNLFVIPTFAGFYQNIDVPLPWQTRILINVSNFFVNYIAYIIVLTIAGIFLLFRYIRTPSGRVRWDRFLLRIPFMGRLIGRTILVRFSQALAIVINSGVSVPQGLILVKQLLANQYINSQISLMQEAIERGQAFTQSITNIELFSPLELQIIAVGEKNGELGPALSYIGNFHTHEIEFELKRINDLIGPIMVAAISILILIIALGVYLPIWNMINLVRG